MKRLTCGCGAMMMVVALVCLAQDANAREGGSCRDLRTGRTVSSYRNTFGGRTVTTRNRNGAVVSCRNVGDRVGGSCTDPRTGRTTSSWRLPNGAHQITVRNQTGCAIRPVQPAANQGCARNRVGGSCTDTRTGRTISSYLNVFGGRTVTVFNGNGAVISCRPVGNPVGASCTDINTGVTTSSYLNPHGTHTVTVRAPSGKVIKQGVPSNRVGGSCFDPQTGLTTSSYQNPDGSRTITVRDQSNKVLNVRVVR